MSRPSRSALQRLGLGALSIGIVVATFAFVLPTIADYRDVWALVQDLSWEWIVLLCVATLVNLLTFAPPWMIALPGLSFGQAITVTQVSTALSIVVPGGLAAGVATSYAMLRRWGFVSRDVARAVTLTGLWNQFLLPVALNTDPAKYVLSQGMASFASQAGYSVDYGALFAAVVITVLPVLIVYIIFQRQLQGSVAQGTSR